MSNPNNPSATFFQPLSGPLQTLQRVGVIYWQSGTVRLFLKLAVLFVVPATCLLLALVYTALHSHTSSSDNSFWTNFRYYAAILGSQSIIRSTLGAIAEGAIAVAVADLYLERHPRWFTCLQKASVKVVTLLMAGLIAGIAILLGYTCFYIPGLLLKINFLLVVPVIMLEDEISVLSALGRSWDLVQGERWYAFKCLLGLELLYWASNYALRSFLYSEDETKPFMTLTYHLLAALPKSIFVPAYGIFKTVLYIDLMILKENLTEEQFANQVDQGMLDTAASSHTLPLLVDHHDMMSVEQQQQHTTPTIEYTVSEIDMFPPSDTDSSASMAISSYDTAQQEF